MGIIRVDGQAAFPAHTKRVPCAGLMLGHRLRRWPNIEPALWLCKCLVFSGFPPGDYT